MSDAAAIAVPAAAPAAVPAPASPPAPDGTDLFATLLGLALPVFYMWHRLLNRVFPQRVSDEGERQGMDLHELGAGAYPEFVVHREDFGQR